MNDKEKIINIIDNVLTDCEVDLDGCVTETKLTIKIIKNALYWYCYILKDKISDYYDFEVEESE